MKLKNKLLPFVGIAAVGATFAPLALTSCKSNTTSDSVIDLTDWYTPTIEKHAFDTLSEDEAFNLYFRGDETETQDWMDDDEMIERLTQDYLFGSSLYVQYLKNNKLLLSGDNFNTINGLKDGENEATYFELLGVEGVENMEEVVVPGRKAQELVSSTQYNKYDVSMSDVKVGHMTNYYGSILGKEFPTISFELSFDIEMTRVSNGNGISMSKSGQISQFNTSNTTQTHKGTLSLVNVPVSIGADYSDYLGADAWYLYLDTNTIKQTETSTRVPFSISITDNVSYETSANIDNRDQQMSGTTTYSKEYYSNMNWYNFASDDQQTAADKVYDDAFEYAERELEYTEARAKEYANREKNKYLINSCGVIENSIGEVSYRFFEVISYYLFSVACK